MRNQYTGCALYLRECVSRLGLKLGNLVQIRRRRRVLRSEAFPCRRTYELWNRSQPYRKPGFVTIQKKRTDRITDTNFFPLYFIDHDMEKKYFEYTYFIYHTGVQTGSGPKHTNRFRIRKSGANISIYQAKRKNL